MGYSVLVNVLWFLGWKEGGKWLIRADDNDLGLDVSGEEREKQTNLRAVMLETGRKEETT